MSSDSFLASNPAGRIEALLDPGSFREIVQEARGALTAGTGTVGGTAVTIAATDRDVAGGSFGVVESQALSALLQQSRTAGTPVILCLDSAGARLDEGLPALGAFRQLYRHFLDLRLAGVSTLAILGRDCFGGASMLAAACGRRVYSAASRLAMSGPAVIQALGGRQELDAEDAEAVTALMGGAARVRLLPADRLCTDTPGDFRQAVLGWTDQRDAESQLDLREQHNHLGTRLLERGMAPSPQSNAETAPPAALLEVVPPGFQARTIDGVLIGRTTKTSPDTFFGLVTREPVGALALWTLAGVCLSAADSRPDEAVMLLLDAPGQAPTLRDERVMLSQYVAHLALVLAHLSHAYPDGCSIYFTLVATRAGDALSRYDALVDSALGAALAEGATLSHHHGVGSSKAHWLDAELGGGLETLRRVRGAWDPDRLLNPGTFEALRAAPDVKPREPLPGIDALSGIATFRGDTQLSEIQSAAHAKGFSLGLAGPLPALTLDDFVARGLPGLPDPFSDPVRGSVCGLEARGGVARFRLLATPRRATGPNLAALCVGAGGEIARVESASLALVRQGALRSDAAFVSTPLAADERAAWQRIVDAFR